MKIFSSTYCFSKIDSVGSTTHTIHKVELNMLPKEKREKVCECLERIHLSHKEKSTRKELCKLLYTFLFDF